MITSRVSQFSPRYVVEEGDEEYYEFEKTNNSTLTRIRNLSDSLDTTDRLHSTAPVKSIMKSVKKVSESYKDAFARTKKKDFLKPIKLVKELIQLKKKYKDNKKIENLFKYIYNDLNRCQTGEALPLCDLIVVNDKGKSINTLNAVIKPMREYRTNYDSYASGKRKTKKKRIIKKRKKTNRMKGKLPAKKRKTKRKYN
tara:strand:- start:1392 stop:1985 length:594 start_codon:yes stop_codon:yes gene_type:complete